MATNAQKAALAEKAHGDRIARFWARFVIVVMLSFSLSANILSALKYGRDPIGLGMSGVPAISLFVSATLVERMRKFSWYVVVGFIIAIIVSLGSSWYHITTLAIDHHIHPVIAVFLPLSVDVPMLLASKSLIDHKATVILPTPANRTIKTDPIKSVPTPRKRTLKAIPTAS